MTDVMNEVLEETGTGDTPVHPFRATATESDLTDMRRRIAATRWPERETVDDDSQGVRLAAMQDLARYWATGYDWRKCETRLNALPQFITEIDGLDIHFVHVRSRHPDALPIIVTHGWPGSVVEQLKIIDPLANPTAHGGSASDAFHVVVPSIPGYGFSGKPTATGWGPERIARAWTTLMKRLGYDRFVAQGGDWGAIITEYMAVQTPPELLGIHVNMAGAIPPDVYQTLQAGGSVPPGLSNEERATFDKLKGFFAKGVAYGIEMGTRPQTLYGIADSPVALAAWLLDHGDGTGQPGTAVSTAMRTPSGADPNQLSRDDILDNATLFWLTNTGISSARLYWENKGTFFGFKNVTIPAAVSVFPNEFYQPPRSWADRAFPRLIHYNKVAKGGHFAAWEQPKIFVEEVRAGLRSLR